MLKDVANRTLQRFNLRIVAVRPNSLRYKRANYLGAIISGLFAFAAGLLFTAISIGSIGSVTWNDALQCSLSFFTREEAVKSFIFAIIITCGYVIYLDCRPKNTPRNQIFRRITALLMIATDLWLKLFFNIGCFMLGASTYLLVLERSLATISLLAISCGVFVLGLFYAIGQAALLSDFRKFTKRTDRSWLHLSLIMWATILTCLSFLISDRAYKNSYVCHVSAVKIDG